MCIIFLTEVAVQNLCNHSRSRNKEQGQKGEPISYKYETNNGSGMSGPVVGPFWGLADICLLCPRPSGIQACTLFILPLAPRAHFQICRQMDGHNYANSFFVAKCTWKSYFPKLPLRHFKYWKPGKFFRFTLKLTRTPLCRSSLQFQKEKIFLKRFFINCLSMVLHNFTWFLICIKTTQ